MSRQEIFVEKLFDGCDFYHNQRLVIEGQKILSIEPAEKNSKFLAGTLSAGFIDIQVNGGGGFFFNESPDADTLKQIAKAHQKFGTSGWLPTLITDSIEVMGRAADAVAKARLDKDNGILGVHFEGPHLSTFKRGVHSAGHIRELSEKEMNIFCRQDLGKVMVTIAPENVSPEHIGELVSKGVIVCLGHTNAKYEVVQKAIDAGATGFTHLFNAMSGLTSREPGTVGAALVNQGSYYGLILDGVHVHPITAKVAFNANSNLLLVTDAMPPVGTNAQSFELPSGKVVRDGMTLRDIEGRLAGSVLDMATAVKNAKTMLSLSATDALNAATNKPAKFLRIDDEYGTLAPGKKASMVLIDSNDEVSACWVDGTLVV